ncbi:MAG: ATP-binding protein, partial [Myxococcota bacterium]
EKLPAATYVCGAAEPWPAFYVSPPIESILGYTPTEWTLSPTAWVDALHPADLDRVLQLRREASAARAPFRAEYRMRARDGRWLWIRDELRPEPEAHGERMRGLFLDITEHRVLQEQVREAQRLESVGQLAGGIAHDFNNLLSVIISYSSLALRRVPDPSKARELHQIRRAADRAAALTKQLLAYSRRQVLDARVLDLKVCIADVHDMHKRALGEDITLTEEFAPDLPWVRVDRVQLEQVLLNLMVNARDATPPGGSVRVVTRSRKLDAEAARALGVVAGEYAEVAVTDTGCGMTEEVREHLFEPFFTTKEVGKGTGLGLATSYGIVRQSGGFIEVESEPGRGSTFRVALPGVREMPVPEPAPEAPAPRAEGGHETILVVEDEPAVREATTGVLAEQGYRVIEAANGLEALEVMAARGNEVHLLFTDVVMPGIHGTELVRRVRERWPTIRVLYTTGYSEEALPVRPGQTHLLRKPFAPDELLATVRRVLDQS